MTVDNKILIIAAILVGGIGGSLTTAQLIDSLRPYSVLITAGSAFISVLASWFVAKANGEKKDA